MALRQARMVAVDTFSDREAQHGVTQELQPLVGEGLVLGTPRPVGQSDLQ